ncbi:hypothetical protein ACSBR2_019423 [Camellia fascicularis]
MKRSPPPYILWLKDQWRKSRKENDLLKPKQPMFAFSAFTIEAMKLLEEEQYLQLKTKKEKDLLKPKQSMSAFFMFTNERRAALLAESKSVWEVAKIIGEEWKNMTEKQKRHEKIAKQNKEKYLEEMEAYKQRKEEESANLKKEEDEMMKIHKQEALQLLKKKEKIDDIMKKMKENRQKKKKIADPNKPKKPASSFLLFRSVILKYVINTYIYIPNKIKSKYQKFWSFHFYSQ